MHTMSTGTTRVVLDFDDATPTCWKNQITSHCAKAKAENTICRKHTTSHQDFILKKLKKHENIKKE